MAEVQSETPEQSQGHERRDINVRAVALFGLGTVGALFGSLLLMGWLFGTFETARPRSQGTPEAWRATRPLPPQPRLQASPAQDLQELRAHTDAVLGSYGWVDRSTGIVRIPIQRAMELLTEQGLPTWQGNGRTQD